MNEKTATFAIGDSQVLHLALINLFFWLVVDGCCWFVLREKYCCLVADGWFVVREKYCWLVADKPNEQGQSRPSGR
jgi:hypothetical protein